MMGDILRKAVVALLLIHTGALPAPSRDPATPDQVHPTARGPAFASHEPQVPLRGPSIGGPSSEQFTNMSVSMLRTQSYIRFVHQLDSSTRLEQHEARTANSGEQYRRIGQGWCTNAAGSEGTARKFTTYPTLAAAKDACNADASCVAIAFHNNRFHTSAVYTSTGCTANCDRTEWLRDRSLIVGSSGVASYTCHVKNVRNCITINSVTPPQSGDTLWCDSSSSPNDCTAKLDDARSGFTIGDGIDVANDVANAMGDFSSALTNFMSVSASVSKVAAVLGAAGPAAGLLMGIITMFFPQPDPALLAIKEGFDNMNARFDALSKQLGFGIDAIRADLWDRDLEKKINTITAVGDAYGDFMCSVNGNDEDRLYYRNNFRKKCTDNDPLLAFSALYEHSCDYKTTLCEHNPGGYKTTSKAIDFFGSPAYHNNDVNKFQAGFVRIVLSAMVEAMLLYSACSETSMSDTNKIDNLQKMEDGLKEVARHMDRKIYEIETEWPCEMHTYDMPAGDVHETPKQVFDRLSSKYPGKHWLVLTYDEVHGYNQHTYYNPHRVDLCKSGNSNVGRYHGVHNRKEWHVLWKNASSPSRMQGGINPDDRFPNVCLYPATCSGAWGVFHRATKREIVVAVGNGLTGWGNLARLGNGFGFVNVRTPRHYWYSLAY